MDIDRIKRGLKHPNLLGRYINRLYHTRMKTRDHNSKGIDILQEDWDNLIILDAARYDTFKETNTIEGRLEKRTSKGASTIEFLRGNFRERDMEDTIYITANPQLEWNREQIKPDFFKEYNLWDTDWDKEKKTVLPESVTKKTEKIEEKHPNKKLIVHYMQPHYPFLDPKVNGKDFSTELSSKFWHQIATDQLKIKTEEVWELYNKNLEKAIREAKKLVQKIKGKTIVTSDHGNFIGERSDPLPTKDWGHPVGIYAETLTEVPWLVKNSEKRKEIEKGSEIGGIEI